MKPAEKVRAWEWAAMVLVQTVRNSRIADGDLPYLMHVESVIVPSLHRRAEIVDRNRRRPEDDQREPLKDITGCDT